MKPEEEGEIENQADDNGDPVIKDRLTWARVRSELWPKDANNYADVISRGAGACDGQASQ